MEYSIDMAKSVLTMHISSNRLQRGNYRFLLKATFGKEFAPNLHRREAQRISESLSGEIQWVRGFLSSGGFPLSYWAFPGFLNFGFCLVKFGLFWV